MDKNPLATIWLRISGMIKAIFLSCMKKLSGYTVTPPEIRRPHKHENLESFWDGFDWIDLTPVEQRHWETLGWNEASWQGDTAEPASESRSWHELTNEQRRAAEQLGYNRRFWNYS